MSKRKNLHKYYDAVYDWNQVIDMDRHGNWDVATAVKWVAANHDKALRALTGAVNALVSGFEQNPSHPALEQALELIDEGRQVGILKHHIYPLEIATRAKWERERERSMNT